MKGPALWIMCCVLGLGVSCTPNSSLFEQIEAGESGIHFSNIITESDSINVLENEYIYNGGGIAVADMNHDGLMDLYFTGNMVGNRLYLNKGEFRFEDITAQAGVGMEDRWASGVAAVDINADGWMDLYVAATNRYATGFRTNSLFVHQGLDANGVPIFKEQSEAYGLADSSHTTHSAFFDYDNDGDLDAFLIVDELDETKLPNKYRKKIVDGSSSRTDRLYQNNWSEELGHPVFTDVSAEAGILIEGFSLGVNISDINRDGWKDIFVSNDYLTNDLLYINQGDGTFVDKGGEYFKHSSHSAMGNDMVDVNNDGLVDLIEVDMLPEDNFRKKTMIQPNNYTSYKNNEQFGYTYQYVRNTLQLNQGKHPQGDNILFSEIGMLAGVPATDWSWTPLVADFDNDGFRDIIITNGFPKDVTDSDFIDYFADVARLASQKMLLSRIPSVKIPNYAFRNTGSLTFEDVSTEWGTNIPSFSNGAVYADLDNDGDLDYVVNNINDSAFVFRNNSEKLQTVPSNWLRIQLAGEGQNPHALGTIIEATFSDGSQWIYEHSPYRGYLSSVEPIAHMGLGPHATVDSLRIIWPNQHMQVMTNVTANQVLELKMPSQIVPLPPNSPPSPLFTELTDSLQLEIAHKEFDYTDFNVQNLLPHKLSQYGPGMAVGDVNQDGLDDVYLSGSSFQKGQFLIQQTDGTFRAEDLLPDPVSDEHPSASGEEQRIAPLNSDQRYPEEELGSLLFDVEGDGDLDLYVVSGGYEYTLEHGQFADRLFLNRGGQFEWAEDALPDFLSSGANVKAADFDKDGDLDLFVGGRVDPWQYPKAVSSYLLINESQHGTVSFSLAGPEIAADLVDIGLVCDALWTDFDNDGWVDLILAGEWMPITFLKNNEGKLQNVTSTSGIASQIGWWNSLAGADLDKDGDTDYILGNLGWNTLNKGSDEQPLGIYAMDFDNNGGYDAIPTVFFKASVNAPRREFPFFGRADLIKQYLPVRAAFPLHADFGRASIEQILSPEQRKQALRLTANYLSSSWVENLGNGTFALHPLPVEAQFAPVYAIQADDLNEDGWIDLFLVGNDFGTEVSQGRADALNGLLLLGNADQQFHPLLPHQSGIAISGDAKSLVVLNSPSGKARWISGQNQGQFQVFELSRSDVQFLPFQAEDAFARISLKDGSSYRQELYYGNSFLSQNGRFLRLSPQVESIEIVNGNGEKRVKKLE
ncbi:MAG: VCBS repeat-containing protein [Bacteroidota bacterium]